MAPLLENSRYIYELAESISKKYVSYRKSMTVTKTFWDLFAWGDPHNKYLEWYDDKEDSFISVRENMFHKTKASSYQDQSDE